MKASNVFSKTIASTGLTLLTLSSLVLGQGDLAPSATPSHKTGPPALSAGGLPQPTMKTLQQVEPRVDVQTLEADANAAFVIKRAGSYYLSAEIVTTKDIAISVRASNVTLDLKGFSLVHRTAAGTRGIQVTADHHNVSITNGVIRGFANGVRATDLQKQNKGIRVTNLHVTGASHYGIVVGDASLVESCTSNGNGGGIFVGKASVVRGSVACENVAYVGTAAGISAGAGSTVSHCVAKDNEATGIRVGPGSNLSFSTASGNQATYGILAEDSCTVTSCTASENIGSGSFSRGISVGAGSSVIGCTARKNGSAKPEDSGISGVGIFGLTRCVIKDCMVSDNVGDGIRCGSESRIEKNTCIDSGLHGAGIRVTGDRNRVDGNHCTGNRYGIRYQGIDNLVIRNSAFGNGLAIESGNFSGDNSDNAIGPFIFMNDINDANDDRPWGNFTKTPQILPGR